MIAFTFHMSLKYISNPFLKMSILRFREVKQIPQGHIANKGRTKS